MSYSIIPSPYYIVHIPRDLDEGDIDPDTGNPALVPQDPVVRYIQSVSQFGRRGASRVVEGADTVQRTETEMHISVADPTVYNSEDQVILSAELDDNGDYIEGTGTAYWVDGIPADARQGPWPQYTKIFGGVVRLRRIT